MKVELIKEIDLEGQTWFYVWANGRCKKAFKVRNNNEDATMSEARAFYDFVKTTNGTEVYKETILSEEIN